MNNAVPILIRIFLVVLFPFSALDKIFDWKDALRQANSSFLPGGPVLLVSGILIEFIAPMCIVLAWHDRLAALVLAGFCAVTAILYHNFWTFPDFWIKSNSQARSHFWDFLKNFGLAGGLLLITFGTNLAPIHYVVSHPLSSTRLYSRPVTTNEQTNCGSTGAPCP
ncbi:MAG: DoxX family protein [Acidiferrobacteraceae bacterium]